MKITNYTLILSLLFLFVSCENRTCECRDDLNYSWEDKELEDVIIAAPNAVLDVGDPLAISISRINNEVVWKLRYVRIYNGEKSFVSTYIPGEFRKSETVMEFPQELFEEYSSGALSVEIIVDFFERATLKINGSIFYYRCEDIDGEFDLKDCRWPEQITGGAVIEPC